MKRLLLIRHAKSSWEDDELSDFDRPLSERGLRTLPLVGKWLAEHVTPVESIQTSPAIRAVSTARSLAEYWPPNLPPVGVDSALYTFNETTVFHWLIHRREESLALVGHNPALENLIRVLTRARLAKFPTCAVAEIELHCEHWPEIAPECGELKQWLRPKDLFD